MPRKLESRAFSSETLWAGVSIAESSAGIPDVDKSAEEVEEKLSKLEASNWCAATSNTSGPNEMFCLIMLDVLAASSKTWWHFVYFLSCLMCCFFQVAPDVCFNVHDVLAVSSSAWCVLFLVMPDAVVVSKISWHVLCIYIFVMPGALAVSNSAWCALLCLIMLDVGLFKEHLMTFVFFLVLITPHVLSLSSSTWCVLFCLWCLMFWLFQVATGFFHSLSCQMFWLAPDVLHAFTILDVCFK